ncbi:unnamed protein product [Paramecium sonneborni]|uniref:Uncharacterized protein n=1 Tax=Paramecium sonneborni TaxID=65129 RepID=A0A8S1RKE1_9CILI|nr:unnamed protein product [Paramecium sonneborni]
MSQDQELLTKIKTLEENIQSRHRQIVQLTDQVEELQRAIQNNSEVVELNEKVRMLESQNVKLIEKNQNDVVEWRSKERDFNNQLQALQRKLGEVESELTETKELNKQLINKSSESSDQQSQLQQITSHYEHLLTERDLHIKQRDAKIAEQDLIIINLQKDLALISEREQASRIIQEQLNEQLKILEKRNIEYSSQNQKLDIMADQIKSLTLLKDQLQNENSTLQSQLQELTSNNSHYQVQLSELQNKTNREEKLIIELQNTLKDSQKEYKEEMTKIMTIIEKMKEKHSHEQEQYKLRMHERDDILKEAKKQFELTTKQFEKENTTLITQIQQASKQQADLLKKISDLEFKLRELESKLQESNRQYIKQLEHSKSLDIELKKTITNSQKLQEQIILKDEEMQKTKQFQLKLLQENQDLKLKLDNYAQINSKSKSNELQNLKNQLSEKDQELELLRQQQKSLATQLKTSQGYVTRFKTRVKQLEMDNTELLKSKNNLETLFQEILDQTKQKQNIKNLSALSNNPTKYQMNLLSQRKNYLQENTSTHSQENRSSSQKSNNTTPNKVAKSGDVSFKRPIQVSGHKKSTHSGSQENITIKEQNELNEIKELDESLQQQTKPQPQDHSQQEIKQVDNIEDTQKVIENKEPHEQQIVNEQDNNNNEEVEDFLDEQNDLE